MTFCNRRLTRTPPDGLERSRGHRPKQFFDRTHTERSTQGEQRPKPRLMAPLLDLTDGAGRQPRPTREFSLRDRRASQLLQTLGYPHELSRGEPGLGLPVIRLQIIQFRHRYSMENYTHDVQPRGKSRGSFDTAEQLELELRPANPPERSQQEGVASGVGEGTSSGQGRPGVTNKALPVGDDRLGDLYSTPMPSRRSGAVYNAFSYPTKIDPEAIALFVAAHTSPGDTILDVFAGSGTTGIAARLCEYPTPEMRLRASELGLPVEWGPRNVVLYELSVVGALLSHTMCDPPDPAPFHAAARRVVTAAAEEYAWMYGAEAPDGSVGRLRHAIWTDVLVCSRCEHQVTYWDLAVGRDPLRLHKAAECPSCGAVINTSEARRATEVTRDPLIDTDSSQRLRVLTHVYGRTDRATWQRPTQPSDLDLIERVLELPVPPDIPSGAIRWGDLHRAGYHQGIERFHHFYTRRNLIALGALWTAIDGEPEDLRDALRLLVLSYNATHSTLMTRVVVKNGMKDFVLTGAQSGVLYVSSLPVEKNVIDGVRRKIETFRSAFMTSYGRSGTVRVVNASSTQLDLADKSIDYVFTDPPFGGFIPYSEINQLNEAWLGVTTDDTEEAIVSPAQGKSVTEYGALMKRVFAEVARVMKPDAVATVIFHSSKPDVWAALGGAFSSGGLVVERTSVLDKTQVSFKQVVSEGSTRGDAIFLLTHGTEARLSDSAVDLDQEIVDLRALHGQDSTPQHLYSRYVARCVEEGRAVDLSAPDFYARLKSLEAVVVS